ncbi:MAG: hypothetical protein ACPHRO_01745, partial [Nannocystaceae bacterium]
MDDSTPLLDAPGASPTEPDRDGPKDSPEDAILSRRAQGALAVTALTALAFGGTLGAWCCASILCFLALETRVFSAKLLRARWIPLLLITSVFVTLCGPLLLGHPPASRDHGIHYFQAHTFVYDLLLEGKLRGWTDRINHGMPLGDSYPMLGYFLAACAHLGSFGAISLRASYALFLAALWAASMTATGLLSAKLFRSLEPSGGPRTTRLATWAGCLAGLAWCIDPGSSREGGWNYLMFHGVWPQQLSVTLWVFALLAMLQLRAGPTMRRMCLTAACFGLSIIAHPFGLLATCVAIPALVLTAMVAREEHKTADASALSSDPRRFWMSVGVFLFAFSLAAGNIFILLQSEASMGRGPVPWKDLPTLAARMWSGELFQAQHSVTGAAALLGLLVVLRRRSVAGILVVATITGIFMVGARDALTVLRLDLLVPALKNVQFLRWSVFVKPLWYALAGVGAVAVAQTVVSWPRGDRLSREARALLCLLLGPLIASGVIGVGEVVSRPVGGLHTLEDSRYGEVDGALRAAFQEARAQTPERDLRVAFLRRGMSGGTYPLFALADADADIVIDGHVPAINFERRVRSQDVGLLRSLGVTHVLFDRPLEDSARLALREQLDVVLEAGDYTLATLRGSTGDRIAQNATLKVLEPGAIEVAIAEIEVASARFRRGLTGIELRGTESQAPILMRYEEPSVERRVSVFSMLAALLCLMGFTLGPRLPLPSRAPRWPRWTPRGASIWVCGVLLIVSALAYWRQ